MKIVFDPRYADRAGGSRRKSGKGRAMARAPKCAHEFHRVTFKCGETEQWMGPVAKILELLTEPGFLSAKCDDCDAQLSLGYSDEVPVAVEVRAAELAAPTEIGDPWCPHSWEETTGETAHRAGWQTGPTTFGEFAGWLAVELITHEDRESRDATAWPWDPLRPVAGQFEEWVAQFGTRDQFEAAAPLEPVDGRPRCDWKPDHIDDRPSGPTCGAVATHRIVWLDGSKRYSFACRSHLSLDSSAPCRRIDELVETEDLDHLDSTDSDAPVEPPVTPRVCNDSLDDAFDRVGETILEYLSGDRDPTTATIGSVTITLGPPEDLDALLAATLPPPYVRLPSAHVNSVVAGWSGPRMVDVPIANHADWAGLTPRQVDDQQAAADAVEHEIRVDLGVEHDPDVIDPHGGEA